VDIDRTGRVWVYKPERHKTEHRGQSREIYLGPKAQAVLTPWLRDRPDEFLIGRDPNPHLGLGAGSHYCVGASLATLELRLTLEALTATVRSARVLEPPVPLASTVINGFKQVLVELTPA
jgi:hypothetical protein